MKILFDQGTPEPLRRQFHPVTVDTAAEMGWSELSNGDMLAAAECVTFSSQPIRIFATSRTSPNAKSELSF